MSASKSFDLLLEVGTEEIPAGYLHKAMEAIVTACESALGNARLAFGSVTAMGTPRRLTLSVTGLAKGQEDLAEEMVGPPARVAFDSDGKPTKAAQGFATRNGVPLDALRRGPAEGKKGEYLLCTRQEKGQSTQEILPELLVDVLKHLPWPKSMRWNSGEESFVRPVHWLVCLLGGKRLPITFVGIESGTTTRGHRFLSPGPINLKGDVGQYVAALKNAFVVVEPNVRHDMICAELQRIEGEVGGTVRADPALVNEVSNLVEYPTAVCGEFPEEYLEVPEQVIVSAMRSHQRYFAMNRSDGTLLNRFVTIAGTKTKDPKVVRKGNERVLAARLADAQFFYREDRKKTLEEFAAKLGDVVFQKKLGTIADKVTRLTANAVAMAADLGVNTAHVTRGAALCKADLCSQMVGEFPELQGTMGRRYATLAKEPEAVCTAMEEHYLPRGANDALPASDVATVIGIADRLDTIAGCFCIGVVPTGSADPFGLRRAALAVLRQFAERDWNVDLDGLVTTALTQLSAQGLKFKADKVKADILEFLRVRFRGLLIEGQSLPSDCVDAALAVGYTNPSDALARASAVSQLRSRDDFDPLAAAFKRVANILKGQTTTARPKPDLFVEEKERDLWKAYLAIDKKVAQSLKKNDYFAAIQVLADLKTPVDSFFEGVMVMDKDEKLRDNRLAMLGQINATFTRIADFRQLAV